MLRRPAYFVRIALALLASVACNIPARAQKAPMDAAAKEIADALLKAKQQSVMVFDFSGPGQQVTQLGRKLADDFSAGLARSAPQLKVRDRSEVADPAKAFYFPPEIVLDPESTVSVAQSLSVKALVMGELTTEQDRIHVRVSAYRTKSGGGIRAMEVSWPMTDEMQRLLGKALTLPALDDFSNYPKLDRKTIKPPACLSCPRAEYSPAAMDAKLQGTVELEAIVGEDGRIRNLRVIKGLPHGLTVAAIVTVSKWRLSPAIGPEGRPVAVRQLIEVTFQLY